MDAAFYLGALARHIETLKHYRLPVSDKALLLIGESIQKDIDAAAGKLAEAIRHLNAAQGEE